MSFQTASSDGLIEKYELDNVLKFSNTLFKNLYKAFLVSDDGQRRFLLNKIFPDGIAWGNKGFSNTKIHPIFRDIKDTSEGLVSLSGPEETRTLNLLDAIEAR